MLSIKIDTPPNSNSTIVAEERAENENEDENEDEAETGASSAASLDGRRLCGLLDASCELQLAPQQHQARRFVGRQTR